MSERHHPSRLQQQILLWRPARLALDESVTSTAILAALSIDEGANMARGIFHVESYPVSPEMAAEYNTWYNEVHLAEIVSIEGFRSARRLAPVDGVGPYVALYEMEGDDLEEVLGRMMSVANDGGFIMSDALQLDPAPAIRLLEVIADHDPGKAT